jgi:hypothetical protein
MNKVYIIKRLIGLSLLLLPFICSSQNTEFSPPDYIKIKNEINNESSENYYSKLFARYQIGDTSLTIKQNQYLYYGHVFSDDYNPYASLPYQDSLSVFFNKTELSNNDIDIVIDLLEKNLMFSPFDIGTMDVLAYCYDIKGDDKAVERIVFRMMGIVDAILSTGDGLSPETAWHVISVSNEYDLIDILQFEFGGEQSLVAGPCDYLTIVKNAYGIEGFYFNVSKPMDFINSVMK